MKSFERLLSLLSTIPDPRRASRIRKNPGIFARLRSFGYNILRTNQSGTIAQDRYAAALGGLKSILAMTVS